MCAELALSAHGRSRKLPQLTVDPSQNLYSSSLELGHDGRFTTEPLRLHSLLLQALLELELATRASRATDASTFLDSLYPLLAPYHDRARELADCQYEAAACWLAVFAKPYLEAEEREARKLADLLHTVVSEVGWRPSERSRAGGYSHAVFNRAQSTQASYAVAASAADWGRAALERVISHLFRALAVVDGDWQTPLSGLAQLLASA